MRKMMSVLTALLFAGSLMNVVLAGVQIKDENGNNMIPKNDKKDQKKDEKDQKKEDRKDPNDPAMLKKMESIIVPKVEFQKVSLPEAVKKLNELAMLNDPEKKGVIFSIDANDQLAQGDSSITFNKENVSLERVLKVICRQSGYSYIATAEEVKLFKPDNNKKKNKDDKF